ncbi:MAG: Cna B-type domain-containing protein, partial [Lachnospiraceae bacterium]|nr:Cna B-type domain-containing protein [Candidatus Equihabitans merdae]
MILTSSPVITLADEVGNVPAEPAVVSVETPDSTPESIPDAAPEETPESTPEVTPESTPDSSVPESAESGSESDGSDQDADSESTKEDAESTPESTPEDAQAVQEDLNAATQAEKDKILAEVVNITVMKYWNDNNADHGGNLTLTLQRNDGQTYPIVLNAGGGWLDTHSYPKYQSVPENPDGTLGTPVPYSYTLLETESYDGGDTDMSKYFTIVEPTKTDADGTLQMELRNVRETEYKSTKIWRDNENKYGTRPSVSSYINGNISIMQRIGDNTPTAVDLKGKGLDYYVDIQAADDITWNIAFKNLPAYAEDNTPIEYILVESEQIPAAAGHTGYEGSYYEPLYRNEVNFASIEDGLYNKGILTNTLVKDDGFTFNKVWLDDGTEQRPKGSFILYRYVDGQENYQSSSPIQGMDTSLKPVDAIYTFGFEDEVGVLPQYDPEGRMYVYYVKEICNDSRYEKVVDGNLNGDKADKNEKFLVANNGTIYNRRHGTTSVSGSKTFVAGAIQGDKFDVTVQLQKQVTDEEGNISWVNVEGQAKNVGGFTSETMTKSFDFSVPQFDEKGLPLTYRVIETGMGITDEAGKYGTATKESGYVDGDVAEVGAGILNDQDPHGFQFRTEVSNGKLTNVLIGQTDVQITKVWAGGVEPVYPVTGVVVGTDGSEKPFIINEGDGNKTHVVMPRYDERGGEITYNVRESVNGPYVPTYAYEDGSCIGDTGSPADANTPDGIHEILRAATITNGPIGEGTWITVQKEWIDDGDAAHRGDVKVAAFDPDGKIHTYTINGQTVESNTVILNDNNGWLDYIYVSPESNFDCSNIIVREVAVGDSVTLYSDDEVANAINGIDAKGLYDAEFAGRVNAGFNAYGATVTGNHVYVSTVNRDRDANNIATVINRRVGNVVFDFNKTWDDGNNQQGDRPDSLVIEIRRDGAVVGTCTLTEENGWQATTWDDNGEKVFLPKYDESGALYEYTVKETAKDKGQPYDMAAHEYACSSSNKYTVGNAYNAHTSDLYEYKFHNQKSKTVTPIFYKLWLDDLGNMYGQRRPDIFVTLYRSLKGEDGQWSQPEVVREYVDRDWSTQYSPYDWAVTFESLPKYNNEGYEYAYYVRETKSQASSKYEDTYYTGNMVGHWTTSGTPTLNLGCLQGQTTDDQATGNFAGFIPINGTIVNTRFDEVEIEGRKVWTGLSDHWTVMSRRELLDACPEVTISLWREDTDGVRRPVTEADRRGGDVSDSEGDLSDVLNDALSGAAPITAVVDGYNSEYNMGIFDRYDRDGQFVKYFVIEKDEDGKLQKVWDGVYDINLASANNFRLTNVYNGDTGHKVEFDKKFLNIDDQIALGKKMPEVEFILQSYMPVVNAAGEKEYEVEFQTFSSKASSPYYYSDVVIDPDPSTDPKTTWTVTFPGLRKYAPNLQELRYALKEVKINGYTVGQVGEDGTMPGTNIIMYSENGVTTVLDGNPAEIINEYNKLLNAEVTKKWDFRGALVPESEQDNY